MVEHRGNTPSHLSAWSKYLLGWINPTKVTASLLNEQINQSETNDDVYMLLDNPGDSPGSLDWASNGTGTGEYFLVENRRNINYDFYLPRSGLLIWHIDESRGDNRNESHKLVDLEEADGLNHLDYNDTNGGNSGDEFDPFYNNTREFTNTFNPNSKLYNGSASNVSVTNISASGYTMTADLNVSSSDWQYNRRLNITGTTAGAQTNYQMKLTVYKGSGTDTPGVVYLGGNVRDDFGDIRFTKSDGITLLDYWIESYTSGVSAMVWVEVDSIPASPNNASIYLYYGNPSAISASSGASTFVFFDDFPGTGLDTNKWTSSGSVSVSGGKVSLGTGVTGIYSGLNYNTNLVLRSKEKRHQTGSGGGETQSSFQDNTIVNSWDASNSVTGYSYSVSGRGFDLFTRKAGNVWWSATNSNLFDGGANWHTSELTWSDNLTKWKWDDTVVGSTSDTTKIPVVTMRISFGTYTYLQELDWVAVRKYASPEPAWGM